MSDANMPDDIPGLVASGLLRELAGTGEHRRLYLESVFGITPAEAFMALSVHMDADASVTVSPPGGDVALQAIPLDDQGGSGALLVPYLVGEPGPNTGTAGFAAYLRDEVPTGESPRVLLVLGEHPLETVRTAADDASQLPALQWAALADAAIQGAVGEVLRLLQAVLADDARFTERRLERSGLTLGLLCGFASMANAVEVGASLHLLGCYVAAADAHTNPPGGLRLAADWRERIDGWAAPDADLELRLRSAYDDPSDPGLLRVLGARTPFGLDFARFDLADLPPYRTTPQRVRFAFPLRTRGAHSLTAGSRAAVWCSGHGGFSVALARPAGTATAAIVEWADGTSLEVPIPQGSRDVAVSVSGDGWAFGTISLVGGERATLAVFLDGGGWMPVEASLDIDVSAGAFRCSETPSVLAMGPTGALLGEAEVSTSDLAIAVAEGDPRACTATVGDQAQLITLLVDRPGEPPAGDDSAFRDEMPEPGHDSRDDERGATDGGEEESEPDGESGGGAGQTGPSEAIASVDSVVHARIADSRQGQMLGQLSFRVMSGVGYIQTPASSRLTSQQLPQGLDGLHIEAAILGQPEVTAFLASALGDANHVVRNPSLDDLDLGDLPADLLGAFLEARRNLFAELLPFGSVHAIAAGVAVDVAQDYVDCYEALVDAAIEGGRFKFEYERLVLVDSVTDARTGDVYLAPTNPVSVAFLVELCRASEEWLLDASSVLDSDLSACSPRYLLPTFCAGGTWYDTLGGVPLLWRRYRPQAPGGSGDHDDRYISKRIEHYLSVYPVFRTRRQTLSIALVEPGTGLSVLSALRRLVGPLLPSRSGRPAAARELDVPKFEITIVTSSETVTDLERAITGGSNIEPAHREVDRLLRDIVTIDRAGPDEEKPEFAHLAFVFRSALVREIGTVDLDARSGTLFAGGIAAAPGRLTQPGRNETTFSLGTFTGPGTSAGLAGLCGKTLELVGGMPRDPINQGRTRMPATRVASAFLGDIYDRSGWVVHLDRLLGLEAFAPDASGVQSRYLIDYEDRADPAQPGLDAITATARVEPYRLALQRSLQGLGNTTVDALDRILRLYNGVSGRWALDIVGASPSVLSERLGLAAAIASVIDIDGLMSADGCMGLIVPIDELIDALPREVSPPPGRLCDDLLCISVPLGAGPPRLTGRLLEVKYRLLNDPHTPELARVQLERTHRWLSETFRSGGPGWLFRSRDLAELLRGAATRASAFGLITVSDRDGLESALDHIMRGDFELDLTYRVGNQRLSGDFVSVEADMGTAVHRQALAGVGMTLGHVRLGRPVLAALASGSAIPHPPALPSVEMVMSEEGGSEPPDQAGDGEPDQPGPGRGNPAGPVAPRPGAPAGEPTWRPPQGAEDRASREAEIAGFGAKLDEAFAKYQLAVEPFVTDLAQVGPTVIRYRTRPLGRLSISEVERRTRDIGREIGASGEVQVGDMPGYVTVDVPRFEREAVPLGEVLPALDGHEGRPGALQFVAGVAPSGEVRIADLSRLPHLLVAGATGSGKSVFLRGLLVELLRARTPEQLHLVIVDPKRLDFRPFTSAPHLRGAIISDPAEALELLSFTLEAELDLRQPVLEEAGVTSASEFYEAGGRLEDLPQLVILVDEFADLVLAGSDRRAFSELIQRYAQLTRAYGIFLVLATQRPSVDVVTGSIKANLGARIAFSLPSARDSMTVIDRGGAEDLLGDGDLLFYRNGRVERLQAPMATLDDVRAVVQ